MQYCVFLTSLYMRTSACFILTIAYRYVCSRIWIPQ